MNKALLVALREYMENLRTKAFWIGIAAFPLILVLAIGIPVWLEKKKDIRRYAVLDKSGWLLQEVERRASMPDMEAIIRTVRELYAKKNREFERLPPVLRQMAPAWAEISDEEVKRFASLCAVLNGPEGSRIRAVMDKFQAGEAPEVETLLRAQGFDDAALALFKDRWAAFKEINAWWRDLPPKEAARFGSGLSKSRYVRKEVDLSGSDPEAKLKEMLRKKEIFAYFVICEDPVGAPPVPGSAASRDDGAERTCKYVSNNLTDTDLQDWFRRYANEAVSAKRIALVHIAEATARWIQQPLAFDAKKLSKEGKEEKVGAEDKLRQWAPVVFVYLLWISTFTITQMLLTNTIEEKSNKIMEVLLSSVSPLQLMAGKITGIAGTGLTMVVSWVLFFLAAIKFMPVLLGGGPDVDLGIIARDPAYLASFVAYFILGYLLLSAILVGIGSVCNSLKEAQNLMAPVTILFIVPLLAMVPIGKDPNGTIAKVMSYIPPFTPFVMMNRAAGPPSTTEYVVTTLLLVVSIVIALWAAAKVFRIGILMTGKPPKLREILRWIRAPVGYMHQREE